MSLHTECQGQMLLESETSGPGASVSPCWHICMELGLRQTRAMAQWVTNILGRDSGTGRIDAEQTTEGICDLISQVRFFEIK